MVRGQLLFHLLPQRLLTRGGKCLFPRLLVLNKPIRKEVLKVPRSLGLVNRLLPPCMLLTPPLGEEQLPVPFPSVPVGGRLTQFLHHWEKFTTDVWVLSVIRRGIGSCVSGTPSFVGQSDSYVSDLRQGEVMSSVRRSSISITENSKRKFI